MLGASQQIIRLTAQADGNLSMPRRNLVLAAATKAQRQQSRQQLGKLRDTTIRPKTFARYTEAVDRFLSFLSENYIPYPSTFIKLDEVLSEFIEHLWQAGEPKAWAGDALSGLSHFIPAVRKHIHGSWRLHSAWGKAELPARAPPLTLVLVYALAHYCRSKGWTDTLVLLLLGFHTYARTGELFSAKVGDFDIHPTTGMGVWRLPLSKSGQRQGSVESLTINDQWVGLLVYGFCRNKPPGDFLRVASPPQQRLRLNEALAALSFDWGFRWYSVRRGGATHDYRMTGNLPAIMLRGRWGDMKTARIYLTDGLARAQELRLTDALKQRLEHLAKQVRPGLHI
jgi:hypothetical protein